MLKSILNLKGFGVIEASNGQEAIDLAVARLPDLLILDLKLPVVSGFSAIRKIKKHADLQDTPIISVASNRPTCHRRLALAAGCVDHLEKPIEFDYLDIVIDRVLPGERWLLDSVLIH